METSHISLRAGSASAHSTAFGPLMVAALAIVMVGTLAACGTAASGDDIGRPDAEADIAVIPMDAGDAGSDAAPETDVDSDADSDVATDAGADTDKPPGLPTATTVGGTAARVSTSRFQAVISVGGPSPVAITTSSRFTGRFGVGALAASP